MLREHILETILYAPWPFMQKFISLCALSGCHLKLPTMSISLTKWFSLHVRENLLLWSAGRLCSSQGYVWAKVRSPRHQEQDSHIGGVLCLVLVGNQLLMYNVLCCWVTLLPTLLMSETPEEHSWLLLMKKASKCFTFMLTPHLHPCIRKNDPCKIPCSEHPLPGPRAFWLLSPTYRLWFDDVMLWAGFSMTIVPSQCYPMLHTWHRSVWNEFYWAAWRCAP